VWSRGVTAPVKPLTKFQGWVKKSKGLGGQLMTDKTKISIKGVKAEDTSLGGAGRYITRYSVIVGKRYVAFCQSKHEAQVVASFLKRLKHAGGNCNHTFAQRDIYDCTSHSDDPLLLAIAERVGIELSTKTAYA